MARFDTVADRYDAFCATPLGSFVEDVERQMIGALLELKPGETVVDLGCGTGEYTLWMAEAFCTVVGIDESDRMLAKARSKPSPRGQVYWVKGNLRHLPWPSARFDAGLMQVVLEFVDRPQRILHEAMRVIKPGGRLVIGFIQDTGPWARHYRARAQMDSASIYAGAHFWTISELTALMGRKPTRVYAGLYMGPQDFVNPQQAWDLEHRCRKICAVEDAGFVVARYDHTPPGDPDGQSLP